MNYLWSPWRMAYIQDSNKEAECIFCIDWEKPDGSENLVVYRGKQAFVILNRYPYTSGHLMIVPYHHNPSIELLEPSERAEMMELASIAVQALHKIYHPEGYNLGINIGKAAGAGVAGHVHLHVVPRWGGDTNFMSSLAETRVLPEALEDTYRRMKEAWGEI